MQGWNWVAQHWVEVINGVGVVIGLFFTGFALYSDGKTRQVANLLTVTTNHREIWKEFFHHPELKRVLDPSADLSKNGVTPAEEEFVNLVILHLGTVYYGMRDGLVIRIEGLRRDVSSFFSLPIPAAVWRKLKRFQNKDFIVFVDDCLDAAPAVPQTWRTKMDKHRAA